MAEFPFRCLIKKILDGDFPGKQVDWGAWGPRDGMKRVRECVHGAELDLQTLVWTRVPCSHWRDWKWWALKGSNLRPLSCEGSALPLS
jgi:hypothetical protein